MVHRLKTQLNQTLTHIDLGTRSLEVLFWILCLLAFYLAFGRNDLNTTLVAKSLAPLSMDVWWYDTAHAVFRALPPLSKGLRTLGHEYHLALDATLLAIWGSLSFISETLGYSAPTDVI